MDGFDSIEPEDLLVQQQTILVYGIVATVSALACASLLIMCYGCSPIAPFPMIVGWVCVRRGRENIAALKRQKMPDTTATAGVVLGMIGLVLGGLCLLVTLLWGLINGFVWGCVSIAYLNA